MTILELLSHKSIVSFELNSDKTRMEVWEMCDTYYKTDLTKDEVNQMLEELTVLYNQMS